MSSDEQDARHLAESLARASYGRLLAIVAARSGDIAAAEDALSDAFAKALTQWPQTGVPDNPEAWLVVVARRQVGRGERHQTVRDMAQGTIEMLHKEMQASRADEFPDERLKLLFVCAHPAIAVSMRAPLMLQTVLGLDAERIGQAFLVPGTTMGQRLVRAKSKIRDAIVPFAVPERLDLPDRLSDVLNAIYAAYNAGWEDMPNEPELTEDLAEEAIYLAQLTVDLLPDQAEAIGLLALMQHSEARRAARRTPDGAFVPLSEQDPALWNQKMITSAERNLRVAAALGTPGRYQTEAAIQSVHIGRLFDQEIDPKIIVRLHEVLVRQTQSIGAAVSLAAAHLSAGDVDAADRQLRSLDEEVIKDYQPFWVVRGRTSAKANHLQAARLAYGRAIDLTTEKSVTDHLEQQLAQLLLQ